jgi:TPR repeat protein
MNKANRGLPPCVASALVALALAVPWPAARGDFETAAEAIEQGDFETAFSKLEPVAAAGDPRAQDALATLYLRGLGVERDVRAGMSWYCMLAHHSQGGRGIMQAVWYLAEWFRTGGGMPGKHYNDGDRANEDPIRAYFWFSVMAEQKALYDTVHEDSARLGKIGRTAVGSVLYEEEKAGIGEALSHWRPSREVSSPDECLELPEGVTPASQ